MIKSLASTQRNLTNAIQNNKTANVALCYYRLSINKDGEQPLSIEKQRAGVRRLVMENGWTYEEYADDQGRQSRQTLNRPALQKLLARVEDPDVAAVVVYDLDRFTSTMAGYSLIKEIHELGVKIVSVRGAVNMENAEGRFLAKLKVALSGLEVEKTSERQRETAKHLRESGRVLGFPPFGTHRHGKEKILRANPDATQPNGLDIDAVRLAYELYTSGEHSQDSVARALNADGWLFRSRRGELRPFKSSDVQRLCRKWPVYAGYVQTGKATDPETTYIPGTHEPLLPLRLTAAMCAMVRVGRRGNTGGYNSPMPLSGRLACAHCGVVFQGNRKRKGRDFIHYHHRNMLQCSNNVEWQSSRIPQDIAHTAVMEHLRSLTPPDELINAAKSDAIERVRIDTNAKSAVHEVSRLQGAIRRLTTAYIDVGAISEEDYTQRIALLKSELEAAERASAVADFDIRSIFVNGMADLPELNDARLREIVAALYVRVNVSADHTFTFEPHKWCAGWA